MLAAVKGIVQGNTVIVKDDDIREYDGAEVVVTLLNRPVRTVKKAPFIYFIEKDSNIPRYYEKVKSFFKMDMRMTSS
jgi:hypothetical protein